jgi:hypothetical protein
MQVTLERVEAVPGKEPGTGNIRGIGAERRVDGVDFEGGKMDGEFPLFLRKRAGGLTAAVYHVSARFPGPTTPRDFIALIMMPKNESKDDGKTRAPRQFMVVSRPCDHPDCSPRPGFVRGTYESVEVIREVPVEKPLRKVKSSIDLSRDEVKAARDSEHMSKEAVLRAAKKAVGEEAESEGEGRAVSFRMSDDADAGDTEMAIEWLMVTRSDPGGSVPRFMVEKGTPGGIINDAGKFVQWLSSQTMEDLAKPQAAVPDQQGTKPTGESPMEQKSGRLPADTSTEDHVPDGEAEYQGEPSANNSGIYGMFTSALGMATSAVASRVAAFAPPSIEDESDISDAESDTSEISYASAEEGSSQDDTPLPNNTNNSNNIDPASAADNISTHSTLSETTSQALSREPTPSSSRAQSQHEKELTKLQQRMRKAQEKLERAQARRRAKLDNTSTSNGTPNPDTDTAAKDNKEAEKEDQALAKLRDKHAREVARQEEKYRRELQRLADKRAAEERKAEERRKKAAEREEKGNLAMELDRVRAERDVARKEVEMLRERIGELQGQNTRLVARLGREGVDVAALKEVL